MEFFFFFPPLVLNQFKQIQQFCFPPISSENKNNKLGHHITSHIHLYIDILISNRLILITQAYILAIKCYFTVHTMHCIYLTEIQCL